MVHIKISSSSSDSSITTIDISILIIKFLSV